MKQPLEQPDFQAKIAALKDHKLDLSSDEDLSIGLMNLISIEEHLFFTSEKTGKPAKYLPILAQTREMRKELLAKIVTKEEGETWCISKHLLAASMRLMEVGTKALGRQKTAEAQDMFDKAYDLYSLFWSLNLGLLDEQSTLDGAKQIEPEFEKTVKEQPESAPKKKLAASLAASEAEFKPVEQKTKPGVFAQARNLVQKLVDCCIE